ncbi:RpiR family transcriptional regulator [Mycoplasmopsis mustelae]|uniref:RpiR family transcriptional regulator n=1 Tax=Mycoplasmopsis mustelae TaxID=171289 RepID=A0A4R7UEV7_9BACT|nr:MurR/RpiR family transcriptional regulator [Mycoplasmopsis mustelae]TDV24423.1 RpiR family transcriptional regulator [Mycoplasmopsis mustelae]
MKRDLFDDNLKEKIQQNQHIRSLVKFVDYINTDTEEFLKLTNSQLSQKLDISQPTFSRISKNLGFKNVNGLKIYISQRNQYLKDHLDWKQNDNAKTLNEVIKNIKTHYMFTVERTTQKFLDLGYKNLHEYINTLLAFKINLVFGIGESALVGSYFTSNMRKIGFNIIFCQDVHTFLSFSALLQYKTVHITIISRSMQTLEVKWILKYLEERKITYSIWTKNLKFKSAKVQNVVLIDSIEQSYRISALGSKIAGFMICDIIFSYLSNKIDYQRKIFKNINNLVKSWNHLDDNKTLCNEYRKK